MRACELDDEQRIPLRALNGMFVHIARAARQRDGLGLAERSELDLQAARAGAEMHTAGELRPRRREDHEACRNAIGYAIDETQDQRVSPVKVLDPDDDRSPSGEGVEVALPRAGEHLALLQTRKRDNARIYVHADAVREGGRNSFDVVAVGE